MGIVFCVDYTSSMTPYFDQIRTRIMSILTMVLSMQVNIRIGLVKFRSISDIWITDVYEFTQDINELRQWLEMNQPGGIGSDGDEAVGNALKEALNFQWKTNNNDKEFYEKVVILFTDGAPNGLFTPLVGEDPWVISNEFLKQDITLVVVGVGESIVVCDDFYCALAKNTGGAYIPLVNFERIFSQVIDVVLSESEGDTVHQALMHRSIEELEQNSSFKYKYMEHRVNDMINECESIGDIRNKFYKYK